MDQDSPGRLRRASTGSALLIAEQDLPREKQACVPRNPFLARTTGLRIRFFTPHEADRSPLKRKAFSSKSDAVRWPHDLRNHGCPWIFQEIFRERGANCNARNIGADVFGSLARRSKEFLVSRAVWREMERDLGHPRRLSSTGYVGRTFRHIREGRLIHHV